jgi:hydroxymethylbilane synthase
MKLKLGTRGSALATTQSGWFAKRLEEKHPGLEVELVIIKTSGDRFSAEINAGERAEPGAGAEDGSKDAPNVKAMFVKEIETALLDGSVDLAVHSSKDLPADLPEGLTIAAFPKREDPRDAFIGRKEGSAVEDLPSGAVVATASLRRQLQLKKARPDLKFTPIRGNVDTRLRKLREGEAEGLLLAEAGLKRLGLDEVKRVRLAAELVVPAPGQGALAIETRETGEAHDLVAALDDPTTRLEVEIERTLLARIGGGCATPLGVLARADEEKVRLWAFWSDAEGTAPVRETAECARDPKAIEKLIEETAARLAGTPR